MNVNGFWTLTDQIQIFLFTQTYTFLNAIDLVIKIKFKKMNGSKV